MGIDLVGILVFVYEWVIDNLFIWDILVFEWLIDLDMILFYVIKLLYLVVIFGVIDILFKGVMLLVDNFLVFFFYWVDLFGVLDFWCMDNMNGYVEDYYVCIVFFSFYLGGIV